MYDDRYFNFYALDYKYYFLQDSDYNVILLDKNADVMDVGDLFTWNDDAIEPYFNGGNIFDDTTIGSKEGLFIIRENGEQYDVYRFASEKQ